jgi:hypothetical protein
MQTIEDDILKEAKKQVTSLKRKTTIAFNKGNYPKDKMFQCPFCMYLSKGGRGTAKIFSDSNTFFCFVCREWRFLG